MDIPQELQLLDQRLVVGGAQEDCRRLPGHDDLSADQMKMLAAGCREALPSRPRCRQIKAPVDLATNSAVKVPTIADLHHVDDQSLVLDFALKLATPLQVQDQLFEGQGGLVGPLPERGEILRIFRQRLPNRGAHQLRDTRVRFCSLENPAFADLQVRMRADASPSEDAQALDARFSRTPLP